MVNNFKFSAYLTCDQLNATNSQSTYIRCAITHTHPRTAYQFAYDFNVFFFLFTYAAYKSPTTYLFFRVLGAMFINQVCSVQRQQSALINRNPRFSYLMLNNLVVQYPLAKSNTLVSTFDKVFHRLLGHTLVKQGGSRY